MERFQPYIGIPFREHGRDKAGLDCYGLVRLVLFEVFRIGVSDYRDYDVEERRDCGRHIRDRARHVWKKVPNPVPGDVVLLNIVGQPMHCGVYIGKSLFLHATQEAGSCIERLTAPQWSRRISGFFRHRELYHG